MAMFMPVKDSIQGFVAERVGNNQWPLMWPVLLFLIVWTFLSPRCGACLLFFLPYLLLMWILCVREELFTELNKHWPWSHIEPDSNPCFIALGYCEVLTSLNVFEPVSSFAIQDNKIHSFGAQWGSNGGSLDYVHSNRFALAYILKK